MTEDERRVRERIARSRKRRKKQLRQNIIVSAAIAVMLVIGVTVLIRANIHRNSTEVSAEDTPVTTRKYIDVQPELDVELLPVNPYSRPGDELTQVNGIVIHYTANPGTTARQNRDYFANLAETHETYASSHFIIGLEGEIVQCIPCNEIAYATNERNADTIAIECCIEDDTGHFNSKTYQSLIELTTWLMGRYDLDVDAVIRHYDVTGKNCPKYYVENEWAWTAFKEDLEAYIEENGVEKEE